MSPNQNVAVTGSTGLIGRALVPALLNAGASLRLLVRGDAGERSPHAVPGDLARPESLRELLHGADALVHLAGVAHTDLRSPAEREQAYAVNVTGTRNLFAAARDAGVRRIVLLSSAHVYAGREGMDLRETAPVAGDGGYADMKIEAEAAARDLAQTGCEMVVLRPCLTYGPGARFNLHQLMFAVKRGIYVHPGGADAVRSFASVATVAAATAHMLRPDVPGGTYNLADRHPASLRTWVDHLADLLGAPRPRTVPIGLLRPIAAAGSALARAGLPAPLTLAKLHKLTAPFSLNTDALASTGFEWPGTEDAVLKAMADSFLAQTAGR